jgi:hypothetical protein
MLIGLTTLIAACGDSEAGNAVASLEESGTTTSSTTPEEAEIAGEEAVLDYVQCLRDQGLEITDPDFDGEGGLGLRRQFVDDPNDPIPDEVEAAFDACEELRAGGSGRFDDVDLSDYEDRLFAFSECMRTEGLADFPDPDLSEWAPGAGLGPGNGPYGTLLFDLREDPSAAPALATCQAAYGGPGTGGPGSGEG